MTKPLLLIAALALALTGCTAPWDSEPTRWERIVLAGDCQCADGSEFAYWERRADPKKVVLFLNGGDVCRDMRACSFDDRVSGWDWDLAGEEPDNRSQDGFFDFDDGDNPFADYSVVFVSSCTGDAHLGNAAHRYSPDLTVQHRGFVNGSAAVDSLAERYPDATDVVVMGKTAGSVAAPIYGGLVGDRLPDADVTVLGAQSGAWPDHPDLNATVLSETWGAYDAMPAWATDGLTEREWGAPQFWIQAARHNPDLTLARFDYAYDPNAESEVTEWTDGDPDDHLALIDANEKAIESAGVDLHSYTAPGSTAEPGKGHGIFEYDAFYDVEVSGVRLVDWLDALISDDPPDDVRCEQCGR